MLFLAVFCGFLAEYQLEHKIEKDREKRYMQTLVEDLKTDTTDINRVLKFRNQKMVWLDSLLLLFSTGQVKGYEKDLYFFGRTLVRTATFFSNDRTISQLKNSGSLRLIQNEAAADSIMSYQELVETISMNQDDDRNERRDAGPFLARIFNPYVFDKMVSIDGIARPEGSPPLRSYDPALQEDLSYYTLQIKGSNYLILRRLAILYEKAVRLISLLKKEYHLE